MISAKTYSEITEDKEPGLVGGSGCYLLLSLEHKEQIGQMDFEVLEGRRTELWESLRYKIYISAIIPCITQLYAHPDC